MKSTILEIVSGVFVLIGIYLFVINWTGTTAIISTIASNSITGIKALQGR
jgi:hypothetical protein